MTPDRLASMLAAIQLGATLPQAEARGLVRGDEERAAWLRLSAEAAAIEDAGLTVEIPVEPLA